MSKELMELAVKLIIENPNPSLKVAAGILKAAANHSDEVGEIIVAQILKKFKSKE